MMKNQLSLVCLCAASISLLISLFKLYEVRTDWVSVMIGIGFSLTFYFFAVMFAFMKNLEDKFDHLTKVLADTFTKLAVIEQKNYDHYNYGIHIAFQNGKAESGQSMDLMSLEDLERERKKAEKEENYEKAALIQRKIDQRKGRF